MSTPKQHASHVKTNPIPTSPPKAKDRPFTRIAAVILGGNEYDRLMNEKCPTCGSNEKSFRDALSEKEHTLSGMCQQCQDDTFGVNP